MKSIYRREFDLEGLRAYKFVKLFSGLTVAVLIVMVLFIKFDYDYKGLSALKYFMCQESTFMFRDEATFDITDSLSISDFLSRYRSWRVGMDLASMESDHPNEYVMSGYDLYNALLPDSIDELNPYLRSFIKSFASMDMIAAATSDEETIEGYIELRRHEPGLIRTWQGFVYSHIGLIQYFTTMLLSICLSVTVINAYVMFKHSRKVI